MKDVTPFFISTILKIVM